MERASWWVDEVVICGAQRVIERQMWCKKVGRKKKQGDACMLALSPSWKTFNRLAQAYGMIIPRSREVS